MVDNVAWHEYGHALGATLASHEMERTGPQLFALLPAGMQKAIDYPGGYRARQVFDEVIATVYVYMIDRAVRRGEYGVPSFLHPTVYEAFSTVIPWPARDPVSEPPDIHAFPATKLGALLRAVADPEGSGNIDADREREIAAIEQRVAESQTRDRDQP